MKVIASSTAAVPSVVVYVVPKISTSLPVKFALYASNNATNAVGLFLIKS